MTCQHDKLDYKWSNGQAGRCLHCGAVENPDGTYDDPVSIYEDLVRMGKSEGAAHMAAYIHLAKEQSGFEYRNPHIKAMREQEGGNRG